MMYNNGIDFGMGTDMGGAMTGTWYNPKTGDSFTVRDWGLENNELKVYTTDGRVMNYAQVQNYVQSDKPIGKVKDPQKENPKPGSIKYAEKNGKQTTLADEGISDEDLKAIYGEIAEPVAETPKPSIKKVESINYQMIDRVLSGKIDVIEVDFNFKNYPKTEIETLKTVLNVPEEEVKDYIYNKMLEKGVFKKSL